MSWLRKPEQPPKPLLDEGPKSQSLWARLQRATARAKETKVDETMTPGTISTEVLKEAGRLNPQQLKDRVKTKVAGKSKKAGKKAGRRRS